MAILKGSQKWVVLPISFPANEAPSVKVVDGTYGKIYVEKGTGGLNDYWTDVSHGNINLDGSWIAGRRLLPGKIADYRKLSRYDKIAKAAQFFSTSHDPKKRIDFRQYYGIVVVSAQDVADAGSVGYADFNLNGTVRKYGTVLVNADVLTNLTFIAHEMGHGFQLDHSYDDSGDIQVNVEDHGWSSQPGEYFDHYDIMSAMNVHAFNGKLGVSGPSVNAPTMARVGWLNSSRVTRIKASDLLKAPVAVTLAPLNASGNDGVLMAVVESGNVSYTVEFRTRTGWDSGVPSAGVLIHRVNGAVTTIMNSHQTNNIKNEIRPDRSSTVQHWQVGQSFVGSNMRIRIRVTEIDTWNHRAKVEFSRDLGIFTEYPGPEWMDILRRYQQPIPRHKGPIPGPGPGPRASARKSGARASR